ncbi:MAG TPA: hypothetical protein VFU31_27940, partial [Candidatus Binatia bacterium]|nr:hypothetical protein [Candidatus Binatia bacterium]
AGSKGRPRKTSLYLALSASWRDHKISLCFVLTREPNGDGPGHVPSIRAARATRGIGFDPGYPE